MQISAAQRELMQSHQWFHAMDLGDGVVTRGRFPEDRSQNQTLFSVFDFLKHVDVCGMDCLDIGATDGLISFGLEKLGAKSVVATDRVAGAGFKCVHELTGSKVELHQPVEISNINEALEGRTFDLIVCAGVIYHMLNPISAITAARTLLRPNGLLIVETAMSWLSDKAVLVFNAMEEESMESSTYWMPTSKALEGMVRLCHFEVLGGRWQRDIGRGAVLGRATPVKEPAPGANTLMRAMQEHGLLDFEFQRQVAPSTRAAPSAIKFTGPIRFDFLDSATHTVDFPLHAHRIDPATAIGTADWSVVPKK